MKNNSDYTVPSVEYAVKIIDFLSRYKNKRSTFTEIHQKLDINKSTCLRILRTLHKYKYVYYDEATKKYGLGVSLVILGSRAAEFSDSLEIVKPFLRNLMEKTGLTTVLVQEKSENRLMYVIKEEPVHAFRVHVNIGQYFPLSPSSFGKCILAFMHTDKREEVLKEIQYTQFTSKTITDVELLKKELANVVLKGYAISHEELTLGVTGIAAPIFDMNGQVDMVILCLGLTAYFNKEKADDYGSIIRDTCLKLTDELGGKPPRNYMSSAI